MTEIYVVRHGIAVTREENAPDEFRPLTAKGRRRFRKTSKAFARLGRKLDLILTSPLVRAVQTAEILAGEAKHGEVGVLEQLDPKFGVGSLLEAVAARSDGAKAVAVVGHEPQLSAVVAALAGVPAEQLDLKKGSIVRLDVDDLSRPGSAEPRWTLKARSKTVDKGLPLLEAEEEEEAEASAPKQKEGRSSKRRSRRAGRRRAAPVRDTGEDPGEAANAENEGGESEKASDGSHEERLDDTRGSSPAAPGNSESPGEPA